VTNDKPLQQQLDVIRWLMANKGKRREPGVAPHYKKSSWPPEIRGTTFRKLPEFGYVDVDQQLRASFGWKPDDSVVLPIVEGMAAGGTFSISFIGHPDMLKNDDVFSPDRGTRFSAHGFVELLLMDLCGQFDIFHGCLIAKITGFSKDYRSGLPNLKTKLHQDVLDSVKAETLDFIHNRHTLLEVAAKLILHGLLTETAAGLAQHILLRTGEVAFSSAISDYYHSTKWHHPKDMHLQQGRLNSDGGWTYATMDL
jgi:hypothetical protein